MMKLYEDCFARGKGQCGILKETLCKTGKCRFYKSKKQYEDDKEKYPTMDYAYKKKMEGNKNG